MIIEFCGLPGAGKSTLVNEMLNNEWKGRNELLKKSNIGRIKRHFLYKHFPKFLFAKDERTILNYLNSQKGYDRNYAIRLFEMYYALKNNGKYLLEEGPIQYITSVAYDYPLIVNKELEKTARLLTKNVQIVFVCDCPIDVVVERILSRGKIGDRYNKADREEIIRLLRIKELNIKSTLMQYSGSVIHLDMTQPLKDNVEKVFDIIGRGEKKFGE